VPQHPFGDLPPAARTVAMKAGRLEDRLEAQSLAVYTTAFDTTPPKPVTGLQATQAPDGKKQLKWQPNREAHLCYYRVYRYGANWSGPDSARQIGSTVATELLDDFPSDRELNYHIITVDQSGNSSP
jgi:hypothetical protein